MILSLLVGDPSSIDRTMKYSKWLAREERRKKRERDQLEGTLKPGQRLVDLLAEHGIFEKKVEKNGLEKIETLDKISLKRLVDVVTARVFQQFFAGAPMSAVLESSSPLSLDAFRELAETAPFLRAHMFPAWQGAPSGLSKQRRKMAKLQKQKRGELVAKLCDEQLRQDCYIM